MIRSVWAGEFTLARNGTILFPPSPSRAGAEAGQGPTILTGENRMLVYARPNEPIRFSMDVGGRWTREGDEATFSLADEGGSILQAGRVVEGNREVFSCTVPKEGLYYLQLVPGYTTCAFRGFSTRASFEASSQTFPMNVYPKNGWWYFYVPKGKDGFRLHLSSPVPDKTRVTLADAGGKTIFETEGIESEVLEIAVPPEMDGAIWSFQAVGPTGWQSMAFWLEGACPYVSDTPEALVIPLIDYELTPSGDRTEVALNLNLADEDLPGVTQVNVLVTDQASAITHQATHTNLPDKVVFTVPNSAIPVAYGVSAGIEDGKQTTAYRDTIWIAHSALFRNIRHENTSPLPQVTGEDTTRGFLMFSRSEPGAIYPYSVPKSRELISEVELWATPGQYAAFHFAVHALNELKDVTYRVSALENKDPSAHSSSVISQDEYDLRVARYWPQRVVNYSNRFHIIPELLDQIHPIEIAKGGNGLFYGRLRIPETADPGAYRGAIEVLVGGQHVATLELVAHVLPFRLRAPGDIHWILALGADVTRDRSGRGVMIGRENPAHEESPEEIRARYQVFRDTGINSLTVPISVEFENIRGSLRAKPPGYAPFNKRMGIIRELGFKEPVVIRTFWDYLTLEADPKPLTDDKRAYTEPARDVYRQHLSLTAQEAKAHQWLDYVYYEVDEPDPPAKRAKFFRTAEVIKETGDRVFCTIGSHYIDEIAEYIDYRCFNGIGYTCLLDRERAHKLREDTAADGDVFWFYGGGSYAYLEGVICGNRYLNGLFLWRSGATGIMNWIACWPMYNWKVDDFDFTKDGWPAKDHCIYYPSRHPDDPLAPTLQWEGIREGIDDYKYLYTFMDLARELTVSEDRDTAARAAAIRGTVQARVDGLPWRHDRGGGMYPPQDITNGDLQRVRQEIIRSILVLADLREKEQQ